MKKFVVATAMLLSVSAGAFAQSDTSLQDRIMTMEVMTKTMEVKAGMLYNSMELQEAGLKADDVIYVTVAPATKEQIADMKGASN